jgi:CBS domain-containing protein
MGKQQVSIVKSDVQMQHFVRQLLNDLQAFEYMLDNNWFESDITKIGAEQEMCIVDSHTFKPAPIAMQVLEELGHYTWLETELAKFNLETNLTPRLFERDALRKMEEETLYTQQVIRTHLEKFDAKLILTGILPTLRKFDLELHNLTPKPRYFALIDAINSQLSKSAYELHLDGIDELHINHNSPLLEACNTSFQVHLQVSPHNFVQYYNIAQALAAPVMAIAANSPLVFGRRLWHESRIALFQQSLDTRKTNNHLRESSPRVQFGKNWLNESILEIHKEDIARFRVLLATEIEENSLDSIAQNKVPRLRALQVFNSTIYRWNRPCYGISPSGKPHLRIENRVLPAGPTVVDEMANAAFWLGTMIGLADEIKDIRTAVSFDDVQDNFLKSAKFGIDSSFNWIGDRKIGACDLILNELLPIAKKGLQKQNIQQEDIDRYLGIIEERAKRHMNGARWQLRAFTSLRKQVPQDEAVSILTAAMIKNQEKEIPVHLWANPELEDLEQYEPSKLKVVEFMRTDLFTVQKDDIIELVAELMDWHNIRYMPVENKEGNLSGLVSSQQLIKYFGRKAEGREIMVKDIMITNPITVEPETTITEAMELMRAHNIGCLPVVQNEELIGIIEELDFLKVTVRLINRLER